MAELTGSILSIPKINLNTLRGLAFLKTPNHNKCCYMNARLCKILDTYLIILFHELKSTFFEFISYNIHKNLGYILLIKCFFLSGGFSL